MPQVTLREVAETDLPEFFEFQRDPEANRMAAFTAQDPEDRAVFTAHWHRLMRAQVVTLRTVEADGEVAGNVVSFLFDGEREIGYWIGRAFWGKGIASEALRQFLDVVPERPLHARAASDNAASLKVLGRCGFVVVGKDRGYANSRHEEIEELILELPA